MSLSRVTCMLLGAAFLTAFSCSPSPTPVPTLDPYGLLVRFDPEVTAGDFTASHFEADSLVQWAREAGMTYLLFAAKQNDGFCLFDSPASKGYNSVASSPAARDFVGELAKACQQEGLKFGLYYAISDWHYPHQQPRPVSDSTAPLPLHGAAYSSFELVSDSLEQYIDSQLRELLTQYGPLYTLWLDKGLPTAAQSQRWRRTIKHYQPDCLISSRIGHACGDYLALPDNAPVLGTPSGAWIRPVDIPTATSSKSLPLDRQVNAQLLHLLQTVSHGGSLLWRLDLPADGQIPTYQKDVLKHLGSWVNAQHDAVFQTEPGPFEHLPQGLCCTHIPASDLNGGRLYVTVFDHYPQERLFVTETHLNILLHRLGLQNTILRSRMVDPPPSAGPTTPFVAEFTYADTLRVVTPGVSPQTDGSLTLDQEHGHVQAAYKNGGYVTQQENTAIHWHVYNVPEGTYHVWVGYTPQQPAQAYRLRIDLPEDTRSAQKKARAITGVLPGIDKNSQTYYAGTVQMPESADDAYIITLEPVSDNALQPLYLENASIRLMPL